MAWVDPETGNEKTFPEVVVALLVAEHGRTKEDAQRMVNTHTGVMVNGMMANMNYRATALALEMKESQKKRGCDEHRD